MIIVTYTGQNYKACTDITHPTWKADKILIYTDTDDFGEKLFKPSEDFNESCLRKIKVIKKAIEENQGQNILYMDTDVMMVDSIDEVFEHGFDIVATRMVKRPDRPQYEEVNAGVSFWKATPETLAFCEEWLLLEKQYRPRKTIPYPEQRAFNDLLYMHYDKRDGLKIGNVSENIYNFERDDTKQFIDGLNTYKPKLIHLKGKRWQNEFCLNYMRNNGIIKYE
jgi:hypothetical protein